MTRRFSMQRGMTRVVFGAGASERIVADVEALGASRVLVVCSASRRDEAAAIAARLGARGVGVLAIAREHVPIETVNDARREAERLDADAVLAFGGGSAIGLAKAIALAGRVRVIAVPTTYSGSEMTPVYGITENGVKKTGRDERVRPSLVVYDPTLTHGLSLDVTVTSLWNAIAHAVEALWSNAPDRSALLIAEEALRLLASSVARLSVNIGDADARERALEGAYLAGSAFADAGGGLHHKLAHVLGGTFGLPHAATHAALLPHVVRFESDAAPDAMTAIARALGVLDPVSGIANLSRLTGAPQSLGALGFKAEDVERVVDAVLASRPWSPRALDRNALIAMVANAQAVAPLPPIAPRVIAPTSFDTQPGFGSTHESEALAGALPRTQNTPHPPPYGLYPDLISGTPFTVRNVDNTRIWMYRVRPAFAHAPFTPLPSARFAAPLGDVEPNRTRWKPMPMPDPSTRVDFLDGMVTLGGAGDPTSGPGYLVHLFAANVDMGDRAFSNADGDILIVPQNGTLDCRTELGWLRAPVGTILVIPRGMKFTIGVGDTGARGWMLEVFSRRLRLPERGPIGSNGLADARHFRAPVASYEDRECTFECVTKLGGRLYTATQDHSPFDVVAWHGSHVPFSYDLSLFNAMGTVTWDHPDPSILTVLTAPLDDHGRAVCDFVVFPPRWEVSEHSFRPPYQHRNAATEVNCVVNVATVDGGYEPGCTFISPLLTSHGVATATYEHVLAMVNPIPPRRMSDESLWVMFESAMEFRTTAWAKETPLVDADFLALFQGLKKRFDPMRP